MGDDVKAEIIRCATRLVEARQREVNHLAVENVLPELIALMVLAITTPEQVLDPR